MDDTPLTTSLETVRRSKKQNPRKSLNLQGFRYYWWPGAESNCRHTDRRSVTTASSLGLALVSFIQPLTLPEIIGPHSKYDHRVRIIEPRVVPVGVTGRTQSVFEFSLSNADLIQSVRKSALLVLEFLQLLHYRISVVPDVHLAGKMKSQDNHHHQ